MQRISVGVKSPRPGVQQVIAPCDAELAVGIHGKGRGVFLGAVVARNMRTPFRGTVGIKLAIQDAACADRLPGDGEISRIIHSHIRNKLVVRITVHFECSTHRVSGTVVHSRANQIVRAITPHHDETARRIGGHIGRIFVAGRRHDDFAFFRRAVCVVAARENGFLTSGRTIPDGHKISVWLCIHRGFLLPPLGCVGNLDVIVVFGIAALAESSSENPQVVTILAAAIPPHHHDIAVG